MLAFRQPVAAQLDLGKREPQGRVVAGGLGRQVGRGPCRARRGRHTPARAGAHLEVGRIGRGHLAEHLQQRVGLAGLLEGRGDLLELGGAASRTGAPARVVDRGRRRTAGRGSTRPTCRGRTRAAADRAPRRAFLGLELRGDVAELAQRGRRVAHFGRQLSRRAGATSRSSGSSVPRRMAISAAPFLSPRALRRSATCWKYFLASASVPCFAARSPDCSSAYSSSGLILRIFL